MLDLQVENNWTYWNVIEVFEFIYLFVLINKPGETIRYAALFSHGTQVAMFSQKCRAGRAIVHF